MIYTINLTNYNISYKTKAKERFKQRALFRVAGFPVHPTEILLDGYLQKNYDVSLKHACYLIILNCHVEEVKDSLIITLSNKKLDKLARLITYGTGKILGSRILAAALGKL